MAVMQPGFLFLFVCFLDYSEGFCRWLKLNIKASFSRAGMESLDLSDHIPLIFSHLILK